jgi:hypothetical protein
LAVLRAPVESLRATMLSRSPDESQVRAPALEYSTIGSSIPGPNK